MWENTSEASSELPGGVASACFMGFFPLTLFTYPGAVREEGVTWASDWVGGGGEQGESFMKRKFWKKNGWKG